MDTRLRAITSWNVFSFIFLLLIWYTFASVKPRQIRAEAAVQNVGRIFVFIGSLIITAVAVSAVLEILLEKDTTQSGLSFTLVIAGIGLLFSWILMHTLFSVRYAYLYYANDEDTPVKHKGGLSFPNEPHPDFIDFAYYSFVIGMTFQVSDVTITDRNFRRLSLFHSLLSFAFNTIIVAMTVNIVAGLSK